MALNSIPIFGVMVDLGDQNHYNRNVNPTFLFDFNTHHRPILRRLAKIHNTADDRRTDTAIEIGSTFRHPQFGGLPRTGEGGQESAHSIAGPRVPISSILTAMVYL